MAASVEREGGKVWIEGLERLEFGKQRDSQFFAALTVAMRHMGEKTDYDQLMGYSAAAFRLSVWDKELCPSSPDALGGFNHALLAAKAFGYSFEIIDSSGANEERKQELRRKITACIDAGIPVVANSLMGHGSYGVIAGYEDEGRLLHCRVYDDVSMAYTPSRSWPWKLVFLQKEEQHQDADRSLYRALKTAVELAHTESYERDGRLFSGFAAYRRWIPELTKDDMFRNMARERRLYLADSNGWMYLALADARGSAARSLYRASNGQNENTATHLANAAQAYEAIHQKLLIGQKHAPLPWQLAEDSWVKRVPHPKTEEHIEEWSKEMRHAQADVLRECLALEKQAIAEIEKALAAIKEAEMKTKVEREGGKVWIDYAADIDESCLSGLSHIYRIADVLRYYGEDVDIDWLMGVSGEAFAYYYHPDGTYLTASVHSWDSALAALEAYGYTGEWRQTGPGTGAEGALRTLEREIEAGRLVIAPGIKASRNGINSRCHWWFVVNGVDVEAQEVSLLEKDERAANFAPVPKGDSSDPRAHPRWYGIVRTSVGMDNHYGPSGYDNPLLFVRRAAQQSDRRALALGAMERAVRIAREEPVRLSDWGGGEYLAGLAALERLLSDLEAAKGDAVEEFKHLNPTKGDPFRGIHEELLHLRLLSERRRAAAGFLRIAAEVLPAAARPSVNAAAERYDEVARLALEAFVLRHGPVEENDRIGEMGRLETYDDNPEWDAYWRRADENLADADKRKELARLIAGALDAERAAIAEIEKALAAEGVEVVITAAAPGSTAHSSNPGGGAGAGGELAERRYDLSGLPGASPLQRRRDDERLPEPLANLLVDEAETGIVGLIEMVTGEKVWEVGHVSQEGSTLTVTNTARVHGQVEEVLETLRAHPNLAVRVELRFIAANPAWRNKWPRLSDATRLLPVGTSAKGVTAAIVRPDQESALLIFVEATDSMTLSAPLVTVFNGQLAYVVVVGVTKVLALQGRAAPAEPVWAGQVVELRPFVEKDLKSICLWLNAANSRVHDVERTRADGTVEKVPEVSITQLVTTLAGPDGSTFLISLGHTDQKVVEGVQSREPRELLLVVKTKALIEDEPGVNLPELMKP